jgi:hypothetical protein
LLGLIFDPEDGSRMSLQNISTPTILSDVTSQKRVLFEIEMCFIR